MTTITEHEIIPQFEPDFEQEEIDAVTDLLSSGDMLLEHKKTREFERKFAEFVNAQYCLTVTSGTQALYISSLTMVDNYRQRIIVPDLQGIFVANALVQANYHPVIFDVSENGSLGKVPDDYWSIGVHANGRLCPEIHPYEDCCQAIDIHRYGTISSYSFASTKHLTTLGQGGAICCDKKEVFDMLVRIKDYGRTDRQDLKMVQDHYEYWGSNFKFTEAQSVFGLEQLKKLPKKLEKLKSNWEMMLDLLKDNDIFYPQQPKWYLDVFVKHPDKLIQHLKKSNIIAKRYPKPLHTQPLYISEGEYPNSTGFYEHGVFLPSSTKVTEHQIHLICDSIKDFYHT